MTAFISAALFYALMWLVFGVLHSALAGTGAKQRLAPVFGRRYRLVYNLFAIVHTLSVFGFGRWAFSGVSPWPVPGWVKLLLLLLFCLGLLIGIMALREYDLGLFSGLDQRPMDAESLSTDGMHRLVRHPLYTGMFLILWSLAATPFGACTALFGSLYLVLGTRSEERKLLEQYGTQYQSYREAVPPFFPRIRAKSLRNC